MSSLTHRRRNATHDRDLWIAYWNPHSPVFLSRSFPGTVLNRRGIGSLLERYKYRKNNTLASTFTDGELKDFYKLSSANVVVTGDCGTNSMSVVNRARQLYRESLDIANPLDKVFCVIDRDAHPDYQQALDAIRRLRPNHVYVAITSVPCFEYWFLLHFLFTDMPFHAAGRDSIAAAVLRELKSIGLITKRRIVVLLLRVSINWNLQKQMQCERYGLARSAGMIIPNQST